jgi:hypothetical protein
MTFRIPETKAKYSFKIGSCRNIPVSHAILSQCASFTTRIIKAFPACPLFLAVLLTESSQTYH